MLLTIYNTTSIIIVILMMVLLSSCQKETNMITSPDKIYPNVDSELWIYFQRFEEAALQRGIIIDLAKSGVTATLDNVDIDNVVGVCNNNTGITHKITLDKNFWLNAGFLRKELAVFHELGHICLKLDHRNDVTADGICKSIMSSGDSACISMYNEENRNEYLDEFFQ